MPAYSKDLLMLSIHHLRQVGLLLPVICLSLLEFDQLRFWYSINSVTVLWLYEFTSWEACWYISRTVYLVQYLCKFSAVLQLYNNNYTSIGIVHVNFSFVHYQSMFSGTHCPSSNTVSLSRLKLHMATSWASLINMIASGQSLRIRSTIVVRFWIDAPLHIHSSPRKIPTIVLFATKGLIFE